jgi:hypothetical protein
VFVFARSGVGASALAEFDFAFGKVSDELVPFGVGNRPVFAVRSHRSAHGEVVLVMPNDVFLEDGDVTVEGLQVQVPEQRGADVDREAVVGQVGREQAPKVVRSESDCGQSWVIDGEGAAEPLEHLTEPAGGDDLGALTDGALEQERLRFAGEVFVLVVTGGQRHHRATAREAAQDASQHMEQLGADGQHAFPVGLGRRDDEQGDNFPVRAGVLADAELGQLEDLFVAGVFSRGQPSSGAPSWDFSLCS